MTKSITWPIVFFIAIIEIGFAIQRALCEHYGLTALNNPFTFKSYVLISIIYLIIEFIYFIACEFIKAKLQET